MCGGSSIITFDSQRLTNNSNSGRFRTFKKDVEGKFDQHGPGPLLGFNDPHLELFGNPWWMLGEHRLLRGCKVGRLAIPASQFVGQPSFLTAWFLLSWVKTIMTAPWWKRFHKHIYGPMVNTSCSALPQQLPKIVFGIDVKTTFFSYLDIHLCCEPFCLVTRLHWLHMIALSVWISGPSKMGYGRQW